MSIQAQPVEIPNYTFAQQCELGCGREATVIAKGCMDKEPVMLCNACMLRGLDLVRKAVDMYQRFSKKVLICGDCSRPILRLDTHLDIIHI